MRLKGPLAFTKQDLFLNLCKEAKTLTDIDEVIDFFTSTPTSDIVQMSEFQIKPFQFIFGIIDLTKSGIPKRFQKVPQYSCVFTMNRKDIWCWYFNDNLTTCQELYRKTMDRFKDGEELVIMDLFGIQPTLKVSGKGVIIHGPAKRKTKRDKER